MIAGGHPPLCPECNTAVLPAGVFHLEYPPGRAVCDTCYRDLTYSDQPIGQSADTWLDRTVPFRLVGMGDKEG